MPLQICGNLECWYPCWYRETLRMENNNLCKVLADNRGSAPGHHFVFANSHTSSDSSPQFLGPRKVP